MCTENMAVLLMDMGRLREGLLGSGFLANALHRQTFPLNIRRAGHHQSGNHRRGDTSASKISNRGPEKQNIDELGRMLTERVGVKADRCDEEILSELW